jgi:hypothetical protein
MKYLTYLSLAGLMLLVVSCGASTADVDATVEARIASIPTPQIVIQEVEKEVVKEVPVEKIVEIVITPLRLNPPFQRFPKGDVTYFSIFYQSWCHGWSLQGSY